jgi:hypothetical protein
VTLSFCTCFDHHDLARGVLMLRSLQAQCPDARVGVLAGSELCRQVLETLALPGITVIELKAVEAAFPALARAKQDGSPVDDSAGLTPFLLQYGFDRDPEPARITAIDANLYFYGDPAPIFAAMAGRSIALLSHLPILEFAEPLPYGELAQGWISVARSATGLAWLAGYRRAVLDGCHDRGGKFARQPALDAWPASETDLAISAFDGAGPAGWNAGNCRIEVGHGGLTVDGELLTCYRFDGVYPLPDGNFEVRMPHSGGRGETILRRQVYCPYLVRLMAERHALQTQFPKLLPVPAAGRRGGPATVEDDEVVPTLAPDGWRADLGDGWQADLVTRRRLLDDYQALKPPPAAALVRRHIAALGPAPVSVLEYGGGLGVLAEACRAPTVDWHLLELPSVCDHGSVLRPQIRFIDDAEAAFARCYDLVLQCDALQYQRDWSGFLHRLAAATRSRLLLLDLPVIAATEDLAVVERPRAFGFRHAMQSWLIADMHLRAALAATGLDVIGEIPGRAAEPVPGAPPVALVGYVLARSS